MRVTLEDQANHSKTIEKSDSFTFDNAGPNMEFNPTNSSSWLRNQSTIVTIADNGLSGLKSGTSKYVWNQISDEKQMTKDKITQSFSSATGGKAEKTGVTGNDWYLWSYAEDNLGNTTIKKAGPFFMDNESPTDAAPIVSSTTHSITIIMNQNDNNRSGIQTSENQFRWKEGTNGNWSAWSKPNAGQITFNETVGIKPNRTYVVQTQAKDIAGNPAKDSKEATVVTKEIKAPVLTADPSTGWTKNDVIVTIEYPTTEGANLTKQHSTDNKSWTTVNSGTTATVEVDKNNTTVYARQYEVQTDTTMVANSFTVKNIDKEIPKITSAVANANKTITINATDTGGSNIAGYTITQTTDTPTKFTTDTKNSWTSVAQSPGTYYAWVSDGAGNVSNYTEVKIVNPGNPDSSNYFTENSTVNGDKPDANNPTIPAGFRPFTDTTTEQAKWTDDTDGGPSENSVKHGLVIQGKDESEFVWIPVPDINKMVMCKSNKEGSVCNLKLENGQLVCKTHSNSTDLCGRLYYIPYSTPGFTYTGKSYVQNLGHREPDLITDYDSGYMSNIGLASTTDFQTQMQEDFDEMAISVAKYGGFYIGRYELSLAGSTSTTYSTSGNGQCKRNMYIAVSANEGTLTWYDFYNKERGYATDTGVSSSVRSSMVWGCQWEAMVIWMDSNGINVFNTPTYDVTGESRTNNTGYFVTGNTEDDKLCNIYDLLGGHDEWTLQAVDKSSRATRGGNNTWTESVQHRGWCEPVTSGIGSRPSLYLD